MLKRRWTIKQRIKVNDRIYAKTVRLIGPEGEQLGIFPRELALRKAEEYDSD